MRLAKRLLMIVAVFFAATYLAYQMGFDPSALYRSTDTVYAALNPFRLWLLALRWIVLIGVWWYWPAIVARVFPDTDPVYEERRAVLLGMRNRLIVMIGVLELCLQFARL